MGPMLGIDFESTCVFLEGFRIHDDGEAKDFQHVLNGVLLHTSGVFNCDPHSSIFKAGFDIVVYSRYDIEVYTARPCEPKVTAVPAMQREVLAWTTTNYNEVLDQRE